MTDQFTIVVPWVLERERDAFLSAWGIDAVPDWLVLQQDKDRSGCGVTKNAGIQKAVEIGARVVVILDGDCYPQEPVLTLEELAYLHLQALEPQPVKRFHQVTTPSSRGTPYYDLDIIMPVAASMGFWTEIGDYCAVRQLAFRSQQMTFDRSPVYGQYFPLCGMNLAFKPQEWGPWCRFIDVSRYDDIWMGWLWQREAYRRGFCFNLNGPTIRHSRQSNVWKNLKDEQLHLEANETLWKRIATHPYDDYKSLRGLLPI